MVNGLWEAMNMPSSKICSRLGGLVFLVIGLHTVSDAQEVPILAPLPTIAEIGNAMTSSQNVAKVKIAAAATNNTAISQTVSITVDVTGREQSSPALVPPQPFESLAPRLCVLSKTSAVPKAHYHCVSELPWMLPTLGLALREEKMSFIIAKARMNGEDLLSVRFERFAGLSQQSANQQVYAPVSCVVFLDSSTLLPRLMKYSALSEAYPKIVGKVVVEYSDYRLVSGLHVPFHIRQQLDGRTIQEINVSEARVE